MFNLYKKEEGITSFSDSITYFKVARGRFYTLTPPPVTNCDVKYIQIIIADKKPATHF